MNRALLALTVALSLFGCSRMEDSATGAQEGRAGLDAERAVAATGKPNSRAARPQFAPGQIAKPKPASTTATMGGPSDDSKAGSKGLLRLDDTVAMDVNADGDGLKDDRGVSRIAPDGKGLRLQATTGGLGMRGAGFGGGGEGIAAIGGAGLGAGIKDGAPPLDGALVDEISALDFENARGRDVGGQRAFKQQALEQAVERSRKNRGPRTARKKPEAKRFGEDEKKKAQKGEFEQRRLSEVANANQPSPEATKTIDIDELAAEVNTLNSRSAIRPQVQDGKMTGLKLGNVGVDSSLYRVGLRSGDVLRSVNGSPVNTANKAFGDYAMNARGGKVMLGVERDGRFESILVPSSQGKSGGDAGPVDADRWQIDDAAWSARPLAAAEPVKTLPRMFYFENTYLGRTAAFQERLRRLDTALSNPQAYVHTALDPQRLDAPTDAGLSITTALDRAHPTEPGRVFLQVALQGSHRYGWRRPPLDLAVVLDPHAMAHQAAATRRMLDRLLTKLGPQDRLGVILATDPPRVLVDVQDLRDARDALRSLDGSVLTGGTQIAGAMRLAGARLAAISEGQARVPGSQTLLVVTNGRAAPAPAAQVAHALTVQGAVTSVIDLSNRWNWWSVANAGHGQLYSEIDVVKAVDAELDRASKVVARLLRVNIKLAAGVRAVRVLGSRMLEDEEVKAVKAREVATDLQISKTMGVKADRGDDDDGIQTVIPFFYGGDAHVIMVELWVPKPRRGMPVAEVSLRYKDMVSLGNATARSHATLDALSGPTTPAELMVRRNVRGFELAEALGKASSMVARGETQAARRLLDQAVAVNSFDRRLVDNLRGLLARSVDVSVKQAALAYAGQRRISHVATVNTH